MAKELVFLRLKIATLQAELASGDYTDAVKAYAGLKLQEAALWIGTNSMLVAGSAVDAAKQAAKDASKAMRVAWLEQEG